jgi:hypothetical protein
MCMIIPIPMVQSLNERIRHTSLIAYNFQITLDYLCNNRIVEKAITRAFHRCMGQNWSFLAGNIVAPLAFSCLICIKFLHEKFTRELRTITYGSTYVSISTPQNS